jgi:hypothetical protein
MNPDADVSPLPAHGALRDGTPRQVGFVLAQRGRERQRNEPVRAALRAHHHGARNGLSVGVSSSVREGTVMASLARSSSNDPDWRRSRPRC